MAFSGGPDSTALLWGMTLIAPRLGLVLHAGHLDHRLDADSRRRAEATRRLAAELDVPLTLETLDVAHRGARPTPAESREAYARRRRYAFLHRLAERRCARFIATAHHADDQAETVLLRWLFGSGLDGLGAMRGVRGRLVRPLLDVRRSTLAQALSASGLDPVSDPTNLDAATPRNAVRSRLLPHLTTREPRIVEKLCRLATAARRARTALERRLTPLLAPRRLSGDPPDPRRGAAIDRRALEALPEPLWEPALALLHRVAGAPYPASASARLELMRQARGGGAIGCDCGHGFRWEADDRTLRLVRSTSLPADFAYNLSVPGSVDVPELDLRIGLKRGRVAPWMFRGCVDRAGLAAIDLENRSVEIRNRRSGDRIRPLGSNQRRRLKDLLIDRRVPRQARDRLPLLLIDGEIAWIPGVTIGERFRVGDQPTAWIAEIERSATEKPTADDEMTSAPGARQRWPDGDSRER